jgi:hypothetical protein
MGGHFKLDRPAKVAALLIAAAFTTSAAAAGPACGLCDTEIVINSELANCFLQKYGDLAKDDDPAIAVDLSDCESSRGIVEALPTPDLPTEEPDTEFLISRAQLDCLKKKLEQPGLVLDPSAKIDLEACS